MMQTVHRDSRNSSILERISTTPESRRRIDCVIAEGVAISDEGLVIPRIDEVIRNKFTNDILEVRAIVQQELKNGMHVLYLPGSYDLVHVGHASFIEESINGYCNSHSIPRDKVFVLALADEDLLIEAVKGTRSSESMPRPIESTHLFGHLCGDISPRLIDLASMPFVNLVGVLPSPATFGTTIRKTEFIGWLRGEKIRWSALLKEGTAPGDFKESFSKLLSHLEPGEYGHVAASFRCAHRGISSEYADRLTWRIQDWHFLLHKFLGDVGANGCSPEFRRVISKHDTYAGEVESIMARCGISAVLIDDTVVASTTAIIREFGWEALVRIKDNQFNELRKLGLIPFMPQT